MEDKRVADMVDFIEKLRGQYGLWEYTPHPEMSRWLSFDLLRSLSMLDKKTDWVSLEPAYTFPTLPKTSRPLLVHPNT